MSIFRNIPIDLCKKDILKYLGYKPGKARLNYSISKAIDEEMVNAKKFLCALGIYETFSVKAVYDNKILFEDTALELKGNRIIEFLAPSSYISFIAATVGNEIESEIRKLFTSGEYTSAIIYDAIGSDAVEQAVGWLNKLIRKEAKSKRFAALSRVSPGYGDWNLSANSHICQLLNTSRIGLTVSDSYQLLPRKSVVAAVGWTIPEYGRSSKNG